MNVKNNSIGFMNAVRFCYECKSKLKIVWSKAEVNLTHYQ